MEGNMVYRWREGTRARVNPQVAGEELERLASAGEVTPGRIVDASRPEDAPLHTHFEWDDSEAAEAYRRDQARYLLRSIHIVREETEDAAPKLVRAFVNVHTEPDEQDESRQVYMPTRVAMSSEYTRHQVLEDALQRIRAWRAIYGEFREFADIVEAIDSIELADAVAQLELVEA